MGPSWEPGMEHNSGVPFESQEPAALSHHCCLVGSALAGSWLESGVRAVGEDLCTDFKGSCERSTALNRYLADVWTNRMHCGDCSNHHPLRILMGSWSLSILVQELEHKMGCDSGSNMGIYRQCVCGSNFHWPNICQFQLN